MKVVVRLLTAGSDESGAHRLRDQATNLWRNSCFPLSLLFCSLEHHLHKGFVVGMSQDVSQPSRVANLPSMSVCPANIECRQPCDARSGVRFAESRSCAGCALQQVIENK